MRWLSYLGARYGIALFLAALIAGLVITVKVFGPEIESTASPAADPGRLSATTPAALDEHPHEGNDLLPSRAPATPVTSPGVAPPDIVAKTFAQAWLRHNGVTPQKWLDGLRPFSTPELITKLTGTDPAAVPADRLTGEPTPGNYSGQSFVEYQLPVDSGNLVLRLISELGQWKVDTIDWERTT